MNRMALALIAVAFPLQASAQSLSGDTWRFDLIGFLPVVSSNTRLDLPGGGNIHTEADPGGYLEKLKMTFMAELVTERGPWSFGGDVLYLNMDNVESKVKQITGPGGIVTIPIDAGTHADMKGLIGTFGAGYQIGGSPTSRTDFVFGARYSRMKIEVDWELSGPTGALATRGSTSGSKDYWDGIVGIRGRADLGGNWDVRYYGDIGAGGTQLTWQAYGAVGYRFGWGDVALGWRHLAYEMKNDRPVSDIAFSGPNFSLGFTW